MEDQLNGEKARRRVKASENAVKVALLAAKAAGLPVDRMCITGGEIVIHFGGVAGQTPEDNDDGLEKW